MWELRANGFEVNVPQMPNSGNPRVLEWLEFLKDYVGKLDADTYFVGHSLGCIAIARYLAELPPKVQAGGCVFVAGFSGRINVPEIAEFYTLPFDVEAAKKHCDKFVMIFSDNDTYVPIKKSLEFAQQLGAKTILERGRGHFSAGDGVTSLPSALSALFSLSQAKS